MYMLQLLQNQCNPASQDIFFHKVQAPFDPIFEIANISYPKIDLKLEHIENLRIMQEYQAIKD
ncbi:unnamed protein product (macronuclear) [Paramecium tetraurelia]|uniref:Uncharacterized protein n=1 Tax=Paramecium tetraurelia TaxID=5888 RepID=A0EDL7_PARTE|nr:uncharacterized protein GSPATT00025728001 [Paramecium tetraurelia]CAK93384.1 unnamed protein product [Paramecium tetraurelia]|eukprot:XP_001460781.1 hypothetical protein (macronuclear) [Paramecium tetraurelia strain d4-2]